MLAQRAAGQVRKVFKMKNKNEKKKELKKKKKKITQTFFSMTIFHYSF